MPSAVVFFFIFLLIVITPTIIYVFWSLSTPRDSVRKLADSLEYTLAWVEYGTGNNSRCIYNPDEDVAIYFTCKKSGKVDSFECVSENSENSKWFLLFLKRSEKKLISDAINRWVDSDNES